MIVVTVVTVVIVVIVVTVVTVVTEATNKKMSPKKNHQKLFSPKNSKYDKTKKKVYVKAQTLKT